MLERQNIVESTFPTITTTGVHLMSADFLTQLFGLNDRVAVVIGGTGVLGGALCDGLGAAGAHVVVAGRSAERGEQRVKAIDDAGGSASFGEVDVYSRQSVQALCEQVFTEYGRCDALVNCAGVNSATPYAEISEEEWLRVINGNLTATHLGCQAFAPRMAEQDSASAILNIGSVTAHLPLSRVFAYSASKAAVVNLTQNLAREYAPQGVRVNVLCPGFFPAEQNRRILDKERIENIMQGTPLCRFGEPAELVGAALLLLAPNAGSFITGAALYVDGGFTANRF
jgi:NAD(P)-dependent dehydrogenase (short-subunit alcohol dehydrogenase family)